MNEILKTIPDRFSCRDFADTLLTEERVSMIANATLAAHSLGLGSVIRGMAGIPISDPRGEELKKRLHFPDGCDFGIAILIGTVKTGKESHEPDRGKVAFI